MNLELALDIVSTLTNEGCDAELYQGYSGRGSYGRETTGVVVEDIGEVYWALGRLDEPLKSFRWDNLGMRSIVY